MNQRFYSLDVFRGATVALMILVNNPGSWSHIYSPLEHAEWHGVTPTDLVFPFFLFAVGNAMAFVMPRLEAAGTKTFLSKVFKRTILILLIGFLLNWSPFIRWDHGQLVFKPIYGVRIFGVLQRIALAYFFASLIIYFFKLRGAFFAATIILLSYWILSALLGNPTDPYTLEGFWGTHIDRAILKDSQIYKGEGVPFDPEGLVSTLPAIAQVIFGYLVGQYIRIKAGIQTIPILSQPPLAKPVNQDATNDISTFPDSALNIEDTNTNRDTSSDILKARRIKAAITGNFYETLTHLFVAGSILLFVGLCWDMVFPINKKIWTSSYVLYTTGLATIILSIFIYLIEVRTYRGLLTRFFDVFGKNPLFIFVMSGLIPRLLGLIRITDHINAEGEKVFVSPFGWFYKHICEPIFTNPKNSSLLYAICLVFFYWLIGYIMDRRKIYVRV